MNTYNNAKKLPVWKKVIYSILFTILSFLFVELLLHILTITKLLNVHALITPWCYQSFDADYAFDVNGSPVFINGIKTYIQDGIPSIHHQYDERGYRSYDSERFLTDGLKIGFFGDSYTEGLQVADEETFARIVEWDLRKLGKPVDIFNFGVGGTGTYHQYLRWLTVSQDVDLDMVVVFFLPQNDVLNNHKILGKNFELYGSPYYTINNPKNYKRPSSSPVDGIGDNSSYPKAVKSVFWLRRTVGISFILRTIYYSRNIVFSLIIQNTHTERSARNLTDDNDDSFAAFWPSNRASWLDVFNTPSSPEWEEAWEITEQVILKFASEVERGGSTRFVLVMAADSLQILYDGGKAHVMRKECDFSYPNRRLMEFCSENRIECLNSLPMFLDRKKELSFPYFSWKHDGHYSQIGHKTMSVFLMTNLFCEIDPSKLQQANEQDTR